MSFTFNGTSKSFIRALMGIKRPAWAPIEHEVIEIPGRPGGYISGKKIKVRVINVPIEVRAENSSNLQSLKNELAAWLITEEPKPLNFPDEPHITYYAEVTGELDLDEILWKGKGVITFLCPDPYKYGEEQTVTGPVQDTWNENFVGKISGSVVENPHVAKANNAVGLVYPSGTGWNDFSDSQYVTISSLNGLTRDTIQSLIGGIAQQLFSFNLIQAVERKYGPIPASDKVTWLKANIRKLTANWHGRGSTLVANPTTKADFVGKVAGSTLENPHKIGTRGGATTLLNPIIDNGNNFYDTGVTQTELNRAMNLDGQVMVISGGSQGQIAQQLFSFNLIEHVQRKYNFTIPGATTADKVVWLKANVVRWSMSWYGKGSSPEGNRASVTVWQPTGSTWNSFTARHTKDVITRIIYGVAAGDASPYIGVDGYIHFLAYADASNGTTPSRIETDFIELEVEVKSGYRATLSRWSVLQNGWFAENNDTHTSANISKLDALISSDYATMSPTNCIDSSGFAHFLAHADPSNSLAPSRIETDYIELEIEAVLPHLPLVVANEGTAESYPVITAKLKKDTTFVAVGNGDEINMIGEPVSVDDIVFEPRTILLNDPMTSTVGWGNAGFTPDGSVKTGTVTSDGNNIIPSNYGTGSAWHGPAVQKSIAQQLQDFSVEFTFNCSARTLAELGKIQLYGLDPTNKKIFMLGMGDYWNSREQNMPEGFLYNATEQRKEVLVRNAEDKFERFYGYIRITRIGREIEFFLKQVDSNGNEIVTKTKKYFDSTNEYQAKLASIGLHFAQFGTYLPIESLGASHVTVTKINQQQGVPIIGRAGDVVVFDNKVDLITLNGEDITKEKAFIGEYFAVKPGTNGIVVEPSDAIEECKIEYHPAYL